MGAPCSHCGSTRIDSNITFRFDLWAILMVIIYSLAYPLTRCCAGISYYGMRLFPTERRCRDCRMYL